MAFHQAAADEVGGDNFGGAGEEGLGEDWEVDDGFGSGLDGEQALTTKPLLPLFAKNYIRKAYS